MTNTPNRRRREHAARSANTAATVTPTWWEYRQQLVDVLPDDALDQLRAAVAEQTERDRRFAALFRPTADRAHRPRRHT